VALRALSFLLGLLFVCPGLAQHGAPHFHRSFDDAEKWSKIFDDPARDAWQKPGEVIRALELPADGVVADIGSGTGYFAIRLGRALPRGRVYGADVSADMVSFLNERAARESLANVRSHRAAESDPNRPAPVDLALVDKQLPGIDGLATIAKLRELIPSLPIMVITGYSNEGTAIAAADLGVVGYVLKPFDDVRELATRVKDAAARYAAERRQRRHLARIKQRHAQFLERYKKITSELDRLRG